MPNLADSLVLLSRRASAQKPNSWFPTVCLLKFAKELGLPLAGDTPILPSPDKLRSLLERIENKLGRNESLNDLTTSDLQIIPYLLHQEVNDRRIGDYHAVRTRLEAATALSNYGTGPLKTLLFSYLRDFTGSDDELCIWTAKIISDALRQQAGVDVDVWKQRDQACCLFHPADGPKTCASVILRSTATVNENLHNWGLKGELQVSGFATDIVLELLRSPEFSMRHKPGELRDLYADRRGSLVKRQAAFLDAVFVPWRDDNPVGEWEKEFPDFIAKEFGRPADTAIWRETESTTRETAERLFALRDVESFFALLGDYARKSGDDVMQRQCHPRLAYWRAYFRRRIVREIKIAMGEGLLREFEGKSLRQKFGTHYSELKGFIGRDKKQSALIMRIGGAVVVDFTHEGRCRVWDVNSPDAPKLTALSFFKNRLIADPRTDLMIDPSYNDTGITHFNTDTGGWQGKLAAFLKAQFGINAPSSNEYLEESR